MEIFLFNKYQNINKKNFELQKYFLIIFQISVKQE